MKDYEIDLEFNSFEEAFEHLGLDVPENIKKSVPSLANMANFILENNVFGDVAGMGEDEFSRVLSED